MSDDDFDLSYLRLSVQRALMGNVSPATYGACAVLDGKQIILTWYVSPDLAEEERVDLMERGQRSSPTLQTTTESTSASFK